MVDLNLCMDANPSNNNIYMTACQSNNPNQVFQYDTRTHRITHGGLCVDNAGSSGSNNVYLFECHDGLNQKWRYEEDTKVLKTLQDDNMCLDWGNGNLYMFGCHGQNNQKFEIPPKWLPDILINNLVSAGCL